MQLAVESIRTGDCDAAVVAGTNLTLTPTTALQFLRLGMLSPEGKCQSFDASGEFHKRTDPNSSGQNEKWTNTLRRWLCSLRGNSGNFHPKAVGREKALRLCRPRKV